MRREFPESPIIAVGAVVLDGDRLLLVRRAHEPLLGHLSLPGGVVELGEPLEEALRREVREETGLDVEPLRVVEVLSSIIYEGERVRYHYVIVDFLCVVNGGHLLAASDAGDARWVFWHGVTSPPVYGLTPEVIAVIEKAFRMRHSLAL